MDYKKSKEKVSCSKSTAVLLALIVLALLVLTSLVTFWITKGIYDHSMEVSPFVMQESFETSTSAGRELFPDEVDPDQPTAEELRLPKNLSPLWYNLTIKTYLPGFVPIEEKQNLTFEAALVIKFRVIEPTDKIVLNALKLKFQDVEKIKLLQEVDKMSRRYSRGALAERDSNVTDLESEEEIPLSNSTDESNKDVDKMTTTERPNTTKPRISPALVAAHVQVKSIVPNETLEMVIFELDGELRKGEDYYFQLRYFGPIDKLLAGMYLSRYKDEDGKLRLVAATQMEPTDARRMVPCFDEPEFKAVWKVKVIHPRGTVAVSNGIEIKNAVDTDDPDWKVTTFKESLPMSSYLLAIVVSDFDFNEGTTSRGTRFRIWSRKEAVNQTAYALESGIRALEFFEEYYNISFPLEKQDLMALPDFAAGAMENWGLVTYRERVLLYDEKLYTPYDKMRVAIVIAHELSHQWFGNLVTMKWWNDLWLNEGFATFMEYLGADAISKGNFRAGEYFLNDAVDTALRRDARASSHPLIFPIDKAEDVSEAFDDISYDKGGSIISMIQHVMGSENFKKGLNIYLNRFKYENAAHNDLWSALNDAVPDTLLAWDKEKFDVKDFASKWTEQMGYPVVEVRRLDANKIELHQKRFKWDDNALEKEKYRNAKFWYKYDIPIWYQVNGEEKPMEWLHEALGLNVKFGDLVVINSGSRGFYRVNYNKEGWDKIINQLLTNHSAIDARSRARLVDDAFALAEGGMLPYEVPLNISQYLIKETEYLPWSMALSGFATIISNFGDEPETKYVREYIVPLLTPLYEKIDWSRLDVSYLNDKFFFENELEYDIIRHMCQLRNINCTERLIALFKANLLDACADEEELSSECSRVPIPIRALVYCEGVRQSAEKVYKRILDLYKKERVQVESERLLAALTCSRDPFTIKSLLDTATNLNDSTIRLQDAPSVFIKTALREVGSKLTFDYFQDNWPRLYKDIRDQQSLLRRIISSSTKVKSERQLGELEAFIKKYRKHARKLDVFNIQLEVSRTTKLWMDRNFASLTEWFKKKSEQRSSVQRA